jgi:hypothetical protein
MRKGDLVVLSAKGMKLKHNDIFYKGFGIVLEVNGNGYYDYGIQWFCKNRTAHNRIAWFKRYEIKKLKTE